MSLIVSFASVIVIYLGIHHLDVSDTTRLALGIGSGQIVGILIGLYGIKSKT